MGSSSAGHGCNGSGTVLALERLPATIRYDVEHSMMLQAIEEAVNSGANGYATRRAGAVGSTIAWAASQNDQQVYIHLSHSRNCSPAELLHANTIVPHQHCRFGVLTADPQGLRLESDSELRVVHDGTTCSFSSSLFTGVTHYRATCSFSCRLERLFLKSLLTFVIITSKKNV